MASPTVGGICDIHTCVLLEEQATYNFPFLLPTYPLMFVHATEAIKLSTARTDHLHIIDAIKYSSEENYTIWEIPITKERLVDLSELNDITESPELYDNCISNIVNVIKKYKIVYFKNLPFNYPIIFKNVHKYWSSKCN